MAKKVYTLGNDGRLQPDSIDSVLPDQAGNSNKVLETDGTNSTWQDKLANKGWAREVTSTDFSNGYIVLPSVPEDVSSIRVYAVGATYQLSETLAANLPSYDPDYAYRFEGGEPRLYFVDTPSVVTGLSVSPVNLFAVGIAYIIFFDTDL